MKVKVEKPDITKLVNLSISFKTKVDALDVGKLKAFPVDLKKLSDVVDNQVVKNKKFKALKTKVNKLDKKILDATNFIQINQYNTDKHGLEKKFTMLIRRCLTLVV